MRAMSWQPCGSLLAVSARAIVRRCTNMLAIAANASSRAVSIYWSVREPGQARLQTRYNAAEETADLEVECGGRDAGVVEQAGGRVQRQPYALARAHVGARNDGDGVYGHLPAGPSQQYLSVRPAVCLESGYNC